MWLQSVCVAFFVISAVSAGPYPNFRAAFEFKSLDEKASPKDWWETASFYQIYPRSFKDSNADGVGDLNGITENLAYLKEIGITATWLSPIFQSPMADFGYDISDFYAIDKIFGTMEDFDKLMQKARELNIKIILDFVPNHSSDECEWFKKSVEKDPEYKDFYVWHPGKMINGTRHPPSNWLSVFRGSAWEWNEQRQEYYLHQFVAKQPDLNYRNPKVQEEMKNVLRFWLKKGIAGFRIDAVPHVFEKPADDEGNYQDEPRNPSVTDPDDYGYLNHIYTVDQPATLDLVYDWRKVMDDYTLDNGGETRILMAEAWSPIDIIMKYYGNGTVNGAQIPFNFLMISWISNSSDANHYAETINAWLTNMPKGRSANWVMGNHDKNRVGSRLGTDRIDMMNMLLLTLPGAGVNYQGEEIGMTDVWISWNDTVDPSACNSNPEIYEHLSRDPERTPFQWNDSNFAGFTTGTKTWLPVAPNYKNVNVKRQRGVAKSHLNLYKQLQKLRRENTFKYGDTDVEAVNKNVIAVVRSFPSDYVYITLANIFDGLESVDLSAHFKFIPLNLEYAAINDRSPHRNGESVSAKNIVLLPKEAVILRSKQKLTSYYNYDL